MEKLRMGFGKKLGLAFLLTTGFVISKGNDNPGYLNPNDGFKQWQKTELPFVLERFKSNVYTIVSAKGDKINEAMIDQRFLDPIIKNYGDESSYQLLD